jgi:hypothetical protein
VFSDALRASGIARRRTEEKRAEAFFLCERRRRRRILDVRAADLQKEMAGQRFSVPPDPTKTAASQRTSQRAEQAIKHSAMQCKKQRAGVALVAEANQGVLDHFGHCGVDPVLAAGDLRRRLLKAHCLDQRLNQ